MVRKIKLKVGVMKTENTKGFTLVELSIVIVIVSLIIAGVVGGQALVRQAHLRGLVTDVDTFRALINNFTMKYNGLPGDITNAYDYWGASCAPSASNCNGDGNRRIDLSASANDNEAYRSWQHLGLSGIWPSSLNGVGQGDGDEAEINVNVPASSINNAGFCLLYGAIGTEVQRNFVGIGSVRTDEPNNGPVLAPIEAKSIDKKIDDGEAQKGRVFGTNGGGSGTCLNGTQYDITLGAVGCQMSFPTDR